MSPRRLILALTDGLRPDAITPTIMPSLHGLSQAFTAAAEARTVRPSATVAALASLATGVAPDTHRLVQPGLGFLPRVSRLRPVARELARHGVTSDVVTASARRRRCRSPGPSPRLPACAGCCRRDGGRGTPPLRPTGS